MTVIDEPLPAVRVLPGDDEELNQPGPMTFSRLAGGALDFRHLADTRYGLRPLVLLLLLSTVAGFDGAGFSILQPLIKHDLGLSFVRFFSITSAVGAAALLLAGPLGYLADRVRRTVLVGVGGIFLGASMLLTGLATTPFTLGAARSLGAAARDLGGIPQFSLLTDYYPVTQRVRMVTLLTVGGLGAAALTLPVVGFLAHTYGWRVAFYVLWIPVVLASVYIMVRLPEPVRGYQEREALGVSEESANSEEKPPSWTESWRLIWSVRVLRYSCFAIAVSSIGAAFLQLRTFYFFQVWHQSPGQLAAIGVVSNVVDLIALLIGGGVISYVARMRPHRVFQLTATLSLFTALSGAAFVLAPVFWLSLVTGIVFGAIGLLVGVGSTALVLNVMPPRARGTAVGAFSYWAIPGLLFAVPVGQMADAYGLKQTLLIGSAFPVVVALIGFVTAKYYDFDVRNAELSAIATQVHERSKREGRTKMLVLRNVDMYYGAVQALFSVDLDIEEGSLIAILGTNGAGKSTLLRTIAGVSEASAGAIIFDGVDITHLPPNEVAARGIVYVEGGRSIFPSLTVRENLSLAGWLRRNPDGQEADLEQAFTHFPALRARLDQVAGTLSSGEQQMLALSSALLTRPRLLMIDELSLGLAPDLVTRLLEVVRAINAQGTTVIVVEQSVTTALRLARRAIFMERGTVRFTGGAEDLRARPDLLRAVFLRGSASIEGAGAPVSSSMPTTTAARRGSPGRDETVLEVSGIDKSFGGREALRNVSLTLRSGEILGLIGPNGAGKTTLLDVISGFTTPDSGSVRFAGSEVTGWSPDQRARSGMSRRFRDARLFPTLTVDEVLTIAVEESDNLAAAPDGSSFRQGRRTRSVAESVAGLVELMHLERYRESYLSDLSTGTRRLVDLAAAVASGPRLLLLDEPAAGIAQAETLELAPILRQLRTRLGCAMVVVEHDIALVSGLADTLMALHLGEVLAAGSPAAVLDDEQVLAAYLGDPRRGEGAARELPSVPAGQP